MEKELLPSTSSRKPHNSKLYLPCLSLVLASSLAMNVIFGGIVYVNKNGWSREAADEAEKVGSISCSGHGSAFLDGLPVDEKATACECFACFTGPDCSQLATACVADADSGSPIFLEPFWRKHAASSAVVVAGWHRMAYTFDNNSLISMELDKHIRKVHALVGNAVAQGKFIVFGSGSTQLLNAAVHALSSLMMSRSDSMASAVKVVASFPFYPAYKQQTDYFRSDQFEFHGDTSLWKNNTKRSYKFIEFVTSPNNPDGQLKKAVLQGPSVRTIHDHAYYWPHYTPIPSLVDEDLMIFTLSKLTGHAGTRFGWALVKDEKLYKKMMEYVDINILGVSHDIQLRALKLLKVVLEKGNGREIFEFAHTTMKDRWQRLNRVLSVTQRFSLQHIPPQFCTFSQRVREASPAYAWLRCKKEDDTDCYAALKSAGIIGRKGSKFGGQEGSRYVRLSLLKSQDDFDLLIAQMEKLVCADEGDHKTMQMSG